MSTWTATQRTTGRPTTDVGDHLTGHPQGPRAQNPAYRATHRHALTLYLNYTSNGTGQKVIAGFLCGLDGGLVDPGLGGDFRWGGALREPFGVRVGRGVEGPLAVVNNGTLNLNSQGGGWAVRLRTNLVNNGTVNINGQTLMDAANTTYTNNGTTSLGAGSALHGNSSSATFTQSSTGTLATTLDAATDSIGKITGSGTRNLAGTLKVSAIGSLTAGKTYAIVAGTTVSGTHSGQHHSPTTHSPSPTTPTT